MRLEDQDQQTLPSMCAWCHRVIGDEEECFVRGTRGGAQCRSAFPGKQGTVLVLNLRHEGRQILAIVPTADSPDPKRSEEVVFQTCSENCAHELERPLQHEWRSQNETGAEPGHASRSRLSGA